MALSAEASDRVDQILARAREFGWTLSALGDALGVSRERVRQRIKRFDDGGAPASRSVYPFSPQMQRREARLAAMSNKKQRILGLKLSDPILQVPVSTLERLATLSALAIANRTWTPRNAPERTAIAPYRELLIELIESHGIAVKSIEKVLGYKYRTVSTWLARHGYGTLAPSQHAFMGVHISDIERTAAQQRLRIVRGGECRRGHLITEDNMVRNGQIGYICGTCRRERTAAAYQRSKADANAQEAPGAVD